MVDDESIPAQAPRPVRPAAFGSVWDSQIGVAAPARRPRPRRPTRSSTTSRRSPSTCSRSGATGAGRAPAAASRSRATAPVAVAGARMPQRSTASATDAEVPRAAPAAPLATASRPAAAARAATCNRAATSRRAATRPCGATRVVRSRLVPSASRAVPRAASRGARFPPELEELLKAQLAQKLGRQAEAAARGVDGGAVRRTVTAPVRSEAGGASRTWAATPRGGRGAGHCRRAGRPGARGRSPGDGGSAPAAVRPRPLDGVARASTAAPSAAARAGSRSPRSIPRPRPGRPRSAARPGRRPGPPRRRRPKRWRSVADAPKAAPEAPGDASGSREPGTRGRSGTGFRRCPGPEAPGRPGRRRRRPRVPEPRSRRRGRTSHVAAGPRRGAVGRRRPLSRPGAGRRRAWARPCHPRRDSRPGGSPPRWPRSSGCSSAGAPQVLLLIGPASIGKTTLALDLAAGLLCAAGDGEARPCRACRACRLVASGTHQDLHRLAPEGCRAPGAHR